MEPTLAYLFISFFICMLLAWLFSHLTNHKERMRMIEKGMNPDMPLTHLNQAGVSLGIKVGIVILGLSIGLAIIAILVSMNSLGRSNAVPLSILGICVGFSLIIANKIKGS